MKIYEVGGAIRDELMGIATKDVDYAVETGSFDEMLEALRDMGFIFYQVKPEFLTVRALAPKGSKLGTKSRAVDFVFCRKDGPTEDGRRPQYVERGTILEDLARRDFTMNALARDMDTGEILDPHDGARDIENRILRFVGDPITRVTEDGLRVVRALRFIITKRVTPTTDVMKALHRPEAVEMVLKVSIERIREELHKMFEFDTLTSIPLLTIIPKTLTAAILRDGLWLEPTLKS